MRLDLVAGKLSLDDGLRAVHALLGAESVVGRGEDQAVAGAPVSGEEATVTRHAVVDDPQRRLGAACCCERGVDTGFVGGDGRAVRRPHHDDVGRLVAAVAVGVDDPGRRLVTGLPWEREVE